MSKNISLLFLIGVSLGAGFLLAESEEVFATDDDICEGYEVNTQELLNCQREYDDCIAGNQANEASYRTCLEDEECESVNRYDTFDQPEDCAGWEETVVPGTYAYDWYDEIKSYCGCVAYCQQEYLLVTDCEKELDACCLAAEEDTSSDDKITFSTDMEVTIKSIEGDVEVQLREGNGEYREAKVGDTLHMGDYIATGFESSCVVIFEGVAEMEIKEMTNFAIAQFFVQGNLAKTAISLRMGEVTTHVHTPKGVRASFEIESPTSTVGVRGTLFKVRYTEEIGITEYFAYEGELEITDAISESTTELTAGEYVYVDDMGYVSEIEDIPDYEYLSQEELDMFDEYEQDTYGFDGDDSDSSDADDYSLIFLVCGGLACLGGGFIVIMLVLLVVRRKKK
jgi:hypothetical protein